jgi:hypothetical protein
MLTISATLQNSRDKKEKKKKDPNPSNPKLILNSKVGQLDEVF